MNRFFSPACILWLFAVGLLFMQRQQLLEDKAALEQAQEVPPWNPHLMESGMSVDLYRRGKFMGSLFTKQPASYVHLSATFDHQYTVMGDFLLPSPFVFLEMGKNDTVEDSLCEDARKDRKAGKP